MLVSYCDVAGYYQYFENVQSETPRNCLNTNTHLDMLSDCYKELNLLVSKHAFVSVAEAVWISLEKNLKPMATERSF